MTPRLLSFLAVSGLLLASACSGGTTGGSALPSRTIQSTGGGATWQSQDSKNAPTNGLAAFAFAVKDNSHLLVTSNDVSKNSLLGDHHGETITASIDVSGVNGAFTYYLEGTSSNSCGTPATTRLFFASTGGPFEATQYWWSDSASYVLANGTATLTATLDPATAWSDYNGEASSTQPGDFTDAARHITEIGLSFGGGCFFENGVGTSDGSGIFTLNTFSD